MDSMTKIKDISSAIEIFKEAANKQAEATEKGDYKTGNKCYDEIVRVITFLKNENAISNLFNLLSNASIGIRMWAAFYLLPTYPKDSIEVLEKIAKRNDIHSLTAETTLNEWRKGNLNI